jgi:hypothetical protein
MTTTTANDLLNKPQHTGHDPPSAPFGLRYRSLARAFDTSGRTEVDKQ